MPVRILKQLQYSVLFLFISESLIANSFTACLNIFKSSLFDTNSTEAYTTAIQHRENRLLPKNHPLTADEQSLLKTIEYAKFTYQHIAPISASQIFTYRSQDPEKYDQDALVGLKLQTLPSGSPTKKAIKKLAEKYLSFFKDTNFLLIALNYDGPIEDVEVALNAYFNYRRGSHEAINQWFLQRRWFNFTVLGMRDKVIQDFFNDDTSRTDEVSKGLQSKRPIDDKIAAFDGNFVKNISAAASSLSLDELSIILHLSTDHGITNWELFREYKVLFGQSPLNSSELAAFYILILIGLPENMTPIETIAYVRQRTNPTLVVTSDHLQQHAFIPPKPIEAAPILRVIKKVEDPNFNYSMANKPIAPFNEKSYDSNYLPELTEVASTLDLSVNDVHIIIGQMAPIKHRFAKFSPKTFATQIYVWLELFRPALVKSVRSEAVDEAKRKVAYLSQFAAQIKPLIAPAGDDHTEHTLKQLTWVLAQVPAISFNHGRIGYLANADHWASFLADTGTLDKSARSKVAATEQYVQLLKMAKGDTQLMDELLFHQLDAPIQKYSDLSESMQTTLLNIATTINQILEYYANEHNYEDPIRAFIADINSSEDDSTGELPPNYRELNALLERFKVRTPEQSNIREIVRGYFSET